MRQVQILQHKGVCLKIINKKYDWKNYFASIVMPKKSLITEYFLEEVAKAKKCIIHNLNYSMFDKPYKRYRRGKNRCKRCGLKI